MKFVVCTIVLLFIANAGPLSAQASQAGDQVTQHAQPSTDVRRAPAISVSPEGNLSVALSRARLAAVLREISTLTEISIVVADALVNDPVSMKMRDVPLGEGLNRLLAAYDVFYLFSAPDNKTPGSIKSIWVYARGEAHDVEPVPSSLWASTKELERQLEDPDPEVRSNTFETIIERQGGRGFETVQRGLGDPDEMVRLRTLSAAIDADIEIPARDLEALILDAQAQPQSVRVMSLRALEGRPEAGRIATTVANDPDDIVREVARQMLERVRQQ